MQQISFFYFIAELSRCLTKILLAAVLAAWNTESSTGSLVVTETSLPCTDKVVLIDLKF